jgi:hypothetical protein
VNISGLDGKSLVGRALDCTTYFKEIFTMEASVDGDDGNGGGVGGIWVNPLWMDAMEEVV